LHPTLGERMQVGWMRKEEQSRLIFVYL
jgi:hypothetical protein